MINFKFLKIHLKQTWLIPICFIIGATLITAINLIGNKTLSHFESHSADGITGSMGAGTMIFQLLVVPCTMALSFALGILLIYKLFVKEVDCGFIGSWLTLPMSKTNVYQTKIFVLIIYLFSFHLLIFSFQEIMFAILLRDFTKQVALYFLTLALSMFFVSLLFTCFILLLFAKFNKYNLILAVAAVLAILFTVFYLIYVTNQGAQDALHYFKYFTILLLLQDPLDFANNPITIFTNNDPNNWYQYYSPIINWINLSWKITIPLIILIPLTIFTNHLLNNKNLPI